MRNLLTDPAWREDDLGKPIPDSPHACSVALPLWDHVVGYEEERPDVVDRMQCGYPRFFWNPTVDRLFQHGEAEHAQPGERCLVFPTTAAARRCGAYLQEATGATSRIEPLGALGLAAICFPEAVRGDAKMYWRYSGDIVSSRLAGAYLAGTRTAPTTCPAQDTIRRQLAEQAGQSIENVFLFPSGMAAVFAVHRALLHLYPGKKSIQVEFPYVDVLHVQQQFGPGVHFLPTREPGDIQQVLDCLAAEPVSGVLCEVATNPLLRSPDLDTLAPAVRARGLPLIFDDTIASSINLDAFRVADVVTTSLTKYVSGASDVMAGSVILRDDSPFREAFAAFFSSACDTGLWHRDAEVLAHNARDYPERMQAINRNAEAVFDYLATVPQVAELYYPKVTMPECYRQLARPGAGYGGLLSLVLKDPARTSPAFYDALRLSKGPSLGTNFSLACPYTLLAHYHELEWAESCGVSRYLIRVSIGLEDPADLIQRFADAFAAIP